MLHLPRTLRPAAATALLLVALPAAAQNYVITSMSQTYTALQNATVISTACSGGQTTDCMVNGGSWTLEDEGWAIVPLGFSFPYFGNTYTEVGVQSNGVLVFGSSNYSYCDYTSGGTVICTGGGSIPSTSRTPHNVIAPWWGDMEGNGSIRVLRPNSSEIVIEYFDWTNYGTTGSFYVQVRLNASGLFQVHYGTASGSISGTVGFEDNTGSNGNSWLPCGSTGYCTLSDWPTNTLFTIGQPVQADLFVPSVTASNHVKSGTSLTFDVTATFLNFGQTAANNFHWRAYVSTDKLRDASDQLVYDSSASGATVSVAGAGAGSPPTTTVTASATASNLAVANYYVLVEADSTNAVTEFSESNNLGVSSTYFTFGIDLVATSVTGEPAQGGPGTSITLNVGFFNQGIDPVPNPVAYRIFATRSLTQPDMFVVYTGSVTVGGGQILNFPVTFTLPGNVAGGDVWWGLELDHTHQVAEVLENNNVAYTAGQTHVQQADLLAVAGDLVEVKTGTSLRKADMGFPARFVVTVDNVGDWPSLPSQMGVIISRDNTLSLLVDEVFADVDLPVVDYVSGQNRAFVDALVTMPTQDKKGADLPPGDYYFFIYLDSFNALNELEESNNTTAIVGPVRLRLPTADYAITRLHAVSAAAGGEAVPLSRTIKNIGTQDGAQVDYRCFASPNEIITVQDFPLRFVEPDGSAVEARQIQLAMGAEDDRTELVRLPGGITAGSYYFGCLVDSAAALPELEEANNARATADPVAVTAQAFQIVTQQLPDGVLGVPYTMRLSTVDAPGPVGWALGTGSQAPEGTTLTPDGALQGTPAVIGLFTFSVEARSGAFTAERTLVVRVLPPTTQLAVTSDNLPPIVNSTTAPYQGSLSACGGALPYTWAIVSGALPAGLSLDAATGLVSGSVRPGVANGDVKIRVRVRDSLGGEAQKDLRLRVLAPGSLSIVTLGLPDSLVQASYLADLAVQVAGGGALSKPITWQVVGGRLPEGLALDTHADQATGIISGKPTLAGTYALTIQATDADGRADVVDFVVRIYSSQIKVFLAQAAPELHPGDPVDLVVTSNGTGTRFRLYSGALPPGTELAADGKLTGAIPDAATSIGVFSFVVEGVDAMGGSGLGAFALEVKPKPEVAGCAGSATGLPAALPALLALAGLGLLRRRRSR